MNIFIKLKYIILVIFFSVLNCNAFNTFKFDSEKKVYSFSSHDLFKINTDRPLITILWSMGREDEFTTNYEFKRLWPFINFASSIGYEVKLNTQAVVDDYKRAVKDNHTYVLIISAHGDEEGYFLDYNSKRIPRSLFQQTSKSIRQIVWATCYGADMVDLYKIPKEVKVMAWKGEIDSYDMFEFINSNRWGWLEDLLRD